MIAESAAIPDRIAWFTSLVSKSENLPALRRALRKAGAQENRVLPMAQGQKQSRILAWTFLPLAERRSR
jgi:23S rRNA (adenine1618-N6)-methyltransferase